MGEGDVKNHDAYFPVALVCELLLYVARRHVI